MSAEVAASRHLQWDPGKVAYLLELMLFLREMGQRGCLMQQGENEIPCGLAWGSHK